MAPYILSAMALLNSYNFSPYHSYINGKNIISFVIRFHWLVNFYTQKVVPNVVAGHQLLNTSPDSGIFPISKICPGSWARECHFSANIQIGSHTRQTTPQFQGGLLLDGQGVEDYTKGTHRGLAHRKNRKSNISQPSPVHSWFNCFRSHSSQYCPPSTNVGSQVWGRVKSDPH